MDQTRKEELSGTRLWVFLDSFHSISFPWGNVSLGDYVSAKIPGTVQQRGLFLHNTALKVNAPRHLVEKITVPQSQSQAAFLHIFIL